MTNIINHQVKLAGRPEGLPKSSDWQFAEAGVPDLEDGQVLVKIHYISVDPAMRAWMNDQDSYLPALKLGDVMRALTVGEVVVSENPAFATGDFVAGFDGVQEYAISDGSTLMKADTRLAPLPAVPESAPFSSTNSALMPPSITKTNPWMKAWPEPARTA